MMWSMILYFTENRRRYVGTFGNFEISHRCPVALILFPILYFPPPI